MFQGFGAVLPVAQADILKRMRPSMRGSAAAPALSVQDQRLVNNLENAPSAAGGTAELLHNEAKSLHRQRQQQDITVERTMVPIDSV